jgi:hypothetical protein
LETLVTTRCGIESSFDPVSGSKIHLSQNLPTTEKQTKKFNAIMTVESFLTRELQVRFIDARTLATEAKLNLGVHGYPSEDQKQGIIKEAVYIFQQRPEQVQATMKRLSTSLDAVKTPRNGKGSSDMDADSSHTTRTSASTVIVVDTEESGASKRRTFQFWPTRKR